MQKWLILISMWMSLHFTPAAAQTFRVNCGGGAFSTFSADAYYSGGSTYTAAMPTSIPQQYGTERTGNFSYTFPTTGGAYDVTLHFYDLSTNVTAPGQRVFEVRANNVVVLPQFDIFLSGSRGPITRTFTVWTMGPITLQFITLVRNAIVNAIEVVPKAQTAQAAAEVIESYFISSDTKQSFAPKNPVAAGSCLKIYRNGLLQTLESDFTVRNGRIVFYEFSTAPGAMTPEKGAAISLIYNTGTPDNSASLPVCGPLLDVVTGAPAPIKPTVLAP